MQTLDGDTNSERALAGLPGWTRLGDRFAKTFTCDDFHSAVLFAERVATVTEAVDHRPDIAIHANTVTFAFPLDSAATGTADTLTAGDLAVARRIQRLTGDHHHPIGLAGA
jgi:4a-hydroxytetrahydrobiopterin dehydratase